MLEDIENLSLKYRSNRNGGLWLVDTQFYGDERDQFITGCIDINDYKCARWLLLTTKNDVLKRLGPVFRSRRFREVNRIMYTSSDRWNSPVVSVSLSIIHRFSSKN